MKLAISQNARPSTRSWRRSRSRLDSAWTCTVNLDLASAQVHCTRYGLGAGSANQEQGQDTDESSGVERIGIIGCSRWPVAGPTGGMGAADRSRLRHLRFGPAWFPPWQRRTPRPPARTRGGGVPRQAERRHRLDARHTVRLGADRLLRALRALPHRTLQPLPQPATDRCRRTGRFGRAGIGTGPPPASAARRLRPPSCGIVRTARRLRSGRASRQHRFLRSRRHHRRRFHRLAVHPRRVGRRGRRSAHHGKTSSAAGIGPPPRRAPSLPRHAVAPRRGRQRLRGDRHRNRRR